MQKPIRMDKAKKAIIWQKWKEGCQMVNIGKAINKSTAAVFSYLRYHGGIQPCQRIRRADALSLAEREEISRGLSAEYSIRTIASGLNRSPSTVSREIKRNGGRQRYRAIQAEHAALKRAERPKLPLLAQNHRLKRQVTRKLEQDWSPEQISAWLKRCYPDDEGMQVSHETIYKSLFIQTRGLFRKEMRNHLRTKRKFRQAKNHRATTRGQFVDGVSISERPACVEDRAIPGHWEGDLICGSQNSYIATIVERYSRFVILVKVEGKDTKTVVSALSRQMSKLPTLLKQSLTWDRGSEMVDHKEFSVATDMEVYFCDPASPWQRGTNENTNGLLRQYFPKGTCLSGYSQKELNQVAAKLNTRPRKTLGFYTPVDKLSQALQ
jgi:IS30 family transposase